MKCTVRRTLFAPKLGSESNRESCLMHMKAGVVAGKLLFLFLFLCCALGSAQGADVYVSTQGNDSNPGTSAQPFRTITRAYSLATSGTTIIVLPGVYTDYQSAWGLHLGKVGTAANPIVLRSQVRGEAIIDGQNGADRNVGIYLDGSYNIIDGFQIKGGPHSGITIYGNANQIINNEIHHNGNINLAPAGQQPGGGQGVFSSEATSDNRYVGNYVHDNGVPGSNLDHGLYVCGDNEWVINNLLVRNAAYGLHIAGYSTVNNMRIYNNVIAFNGKSGIILWMALSGIEIKNNILCQNGNTGIDSWDAHGSGVVVDHNLLFSNVLGDYDFTRGGSDYSFTLGTKISGDPLLVNPNSSGFDAHLQAGSPGINAGINLLSAFTTDKDGALRPASGAWDLGAYVFVPSNPGAPQVTTQPGGQTCGAGQTTSFSITASGTAPLSYQWQKNGANVSGATASSYTTPATVIGDNNSRFRCVVTNNSGSATSSDATLTVLTPSTKFTNGQQVTPSATMSVRSAPAGNVLGTQPVGAVGGVVAGPAFAILSGQNIWWWNVSFTTGVSGWVGEDSLNAYTNGPALPPLMTSLSFEAETGQIISPFAISGGTLAQTVNTLDPALGGAARYRFNITQPGDYIIRAAVNTPDVNSDSFFINIDGEPTDPAMIWDVGLTIGIQERVVSWRGNGTFLAPQFNPKTFALTSGEHLLTIRGREANASLDHVTIEPLLPPPSPPQALRIVGQ
jgi:hypothetical protein